MEEHTKDRLEAGAWVAIAVLCIATLIGGLTLLAHTFGPAAPAVALLMLVVAAALYGVYVTVLAAVRDGGRIFFR